MDENTTVEAPTLAWQEVGRTLWPYPFWIAHRGAGKLAPENTLAAFRLGASRGYRMIECDVNVSQDGVPFLLHDERLERTTSGTGPAHILPWSVLRGLDAGAWHSSDYQGEAIPSLEAVAAFCHAHAMALNIEIKPARGDDARVGRIVALAARLHWRGCAVPPLLTSFAPLALREALHHAPDVPRGLLLEIWHDYALRLALKLQCCAIVLDHPHWQADNLQACHAAGLRALAYTVNTVEEVTRLKQLGIHGIITDEVYAFSPATGVT